LKQSFLESRSAMTIDRRHFLGATAATGAYTATEAIAAPATSNTVPISGLGVDAFHLGVRTSADIDQTEALQRAIDRTSGARLPLVLSPGVYRVRGLTLPTGARLIGVPGATRLVATDNVPLITSRGADYVSLIGLTFDGTGKSLPGNSGLVQLAEGRSIAIRDCEIVGAGRNGLVLEGIEGEVANNTITGTIAAAIFSLDARGLTIARNTIRGAFDNGILVWRTTAGDDGTRVIDNTIQDIAARSGGSGQYGNAINVFRAGNVTVQGNRIRNAAFSAVRGNAASNLQIIGNNVSNLGEVAIYAEFGFEGAVIANNTVDGAALGVAVTNFKEGGRLAVVQGNVIRNITARRPAGTDPNDGFGIGIGVEADSAVTGNVIENAATAGISLGWGQYLRDVTVTGNVVRGAPVGIAVSVTPGAGSAVIADNLIAAAKNGAIVGMDQHRAMTGDLTKDPARFAQLAVSGNRVR
jgi:uncharacterized secreted repeat protein (TIGR03808 family)